MFGRNARTAIWPWLGAFVLFAFLSVLYTWPALPEVLFHGKVIGIGADEKPLSLYYTWMREIARHAPLSLLNGALYSPQYGYPYGFVWWIPYLERIIPLSVSPFATPEQTTFYLIASVLTINALCATWLGRLLKWNWFYSLLLGFCMGFNPFTVSRGTVHLILAGTFSFSLLAIGTIKLARARNLKQALLAGMIWASILLGAHYLMVVILTLFPIAVIYLYRNLPKDHRKWIIVGLAPYFIGLVWIQLRSPISISHWIEQPAPKFSGIRPMDPKYHWDVLVYSAKPLDYLSGSFVPKTWEWNPLRNAITQKITHDGGAGFFPHEHSAGIRWILIIGLIAAIGCFRRATPGQRAALSALLFFIFYAYWCSLSPRSLAPMGVGIGPSRWIHAIFPQIRAPNRWSPAVQLGVSIIALGFFSAWFKSSKMEKWKVPAQILLAALIFLEFPPSFAFPTRDPGPVFKYPGITDQADCGVGVFLPYRGDEQLDEIVSIRGTNCNILNYQQDPRPEQYIQSLLHEPKDWSKAREFLKCLGVKWALLQPEHLPQKSDASKLCQDLGFDQAQGLACLRTKAPQANPKLDCFPSF